MVKRLIEIITVFDDKFIFEFKSCMTFELKRKLNIEYDADTL
ncbi:hypothetical protein [Mogibacterium diversum]|nr:hypothetical protein [Mogibacterium diversum]